MEVLKEKWYTFLMRSYNKGLKVRKKRNSVQFLCIYGVKISLYLTEITLCRHKILYMLSF